MYVFLFSSYTVRVHTSIYPYLRIAYSVLTLCLSRLLIAVSPVCITNDVTIIGGSLEETLRIRCHVAADPTNLTVSWQFSSSEKSHALLSNYFSFVNESVSELIYKIKSERDYGTLACWADNSIGRQVDPCIFQIVPAGKR